MWSVCTRLGVTPIQTEDASTQTRRWAAGDENLWNERSSISSFLRDSEVHQATTPGNSEQGVLSGRRGRGRVRGSLCNRTCHVICKYHMPP